LDKRKGFDFTSQNNIYQRTVLNVYKEETTYVVCLRFKRLISERQFYIQGAALEV